MRRIAVLVGNDTFAPDSGIANLRFPTDDVKALSGLLRDPRIGKYDRVLTLINKRSREILMALHDALDEERGASFLFPFLLSGHGKPSDGGKLYLAANDTTESLLLVNGVSFAAILEMKESLGYGRFSAILDCCFAGLGSGLAAMRLFASCAAAPGSTILRSSARSSATGTNLTSTTTSSASALPERFNFLLLSLSSPR